MRVEIESLANGEFKAIGYGWARSGPGERWIEVIDVKVHVRPGNGGGCVCESSGFLCGGRIIKKESPLTPKELVDSYKDFFDENSANCRYEARDVKG